ncbi:hypothetical protein [Micrococcoides hystricis]|uniref:DUF2017 family protein n=1 Tax=Micrococcoides hystricis TaxID=1572761 RepID=A0ABV6P825_9MICC
MESWNALEFDATPYYDSLIDEFMIRERIVGAFSLADPQLLAARATAEEIEQAEWPPEDTDFEYPPEVAEWVTIQEELAGLQRVIILLEAAPDDVTRIANFRVHGFGQWLRECLWAATGVLPRDPGSPDHNSVLYRKAFQLQGRGNGESAPIT